MPDGLHDSDVLIWSEQQADLLRRLAAGERVNDAVDWANVIKRFKTQVNLSCGPARGCSGRPCCTC